MLLPVLQRLFALASLALLALGGYFVWSWWRLQEILRPAEYDGPLDTQDWRLWTGLGIVAFSLLGRFPLAMLLARPGDDHDRMRRGPGETLETSSGARLFVESMGPPDAPVLVLVHGWGLDASTWYEARHDLASRYRIVSLDLAGLGKSAQPRDRKISLERFADDLMEVVSHVGPRKVVLVGHSIGGMIIQTFCRRYPETLNRQVLGVVMENTTHIDPSRTTILGGALHAVKPLLRLIMRLDIPLQPLVWLMNWQSYLSGSTHLAMRFGGFGTQPTRAQLNQVALLATKNPPAVQAKGNLAMMSWGATDDLPSFRVPAMIFIGGRDIVTKPSAGETIAERMPQIRPVHVHEAGHLGPMELSDDYNGAVAAFADEVFTRGARSADLMQPDGTIRFPQSDERRPPAEPRPFM